ncbi:KdsC family phosphatase [Pseudoalteromonas fenneropenaei]|uniref:3-deoxy-D-manno-octulosonate 8-phosphate phosphatase KdsC n=1 Tax=Pseudoalteromonas fenneropenaei TaxID=1737459 RepID=A0ABV7CHN9_9GAMM
MQSEIAQQIKMVILDVDGVMTDGLIGYGGDEKIKFFHSQDDHLIRMTIRAGIPVAIISGRADKANVDHAKELDIGPCYFGALDKLAAFNTLLETQQLSAAECLYMGDDLMDIPVLRRAGIAAVPADGTLEAKEVATIVTEARGGRGAIREVLVALLQAQGKWPSLMARYWVE